MWVPGSLGVGATVGSGAGVDVCDGTEVAPGAVTLLGAGAPGVITGSAGVDTTGAVVSGEPVGAGASGLSTGPGKLSPGFFGFRQLGLSAGNDVSY
jgi:hypothetical protein